jgi:carboxyl-terminal processing protease
MKVSERVIWICACIFLISVIFSVLVIYDMRRGASNVEAQTKEYNTLMNVYNEAYNIVMNRFVDVEKLETDKLFYGAIRGMVESLGDPHSIFFNPEQCKEITEDIEGVFAGIGAYIYNKDDQVQIVAPIEGTPAAQAGLRANDIILEIDGVTTEGMTSEKAAMLIKGKPGTNVTLKITRLGKTEPIVLTITRAIIEIPATKHTMINKDIGYIRLISFSQTAPQSVEKAIAELKTKGMKKLIIDLRDNPGGTLEAGKEITDIFLQKGKIVYTVGRDNKIMQNFSAEKQKTDELTIPLILLVNENSASASEILAGALKDTQRALIIGKKTFGKGSVQSFITLEEKLMDDKPVGIKITIAHWFTPAGNLIDGKGIEPDIEIKESEETLIERMFYENKLYDGNYLTNFVKGKPNFTRDDIIAYKEQLEKEAHIFIEVDRLGQLLTLEKNRDKIDITIDTEYDTTLKKAISIYENNEYPNKEVLSFD